MEVKYSREMPWEGDGDEIEEFLTQCWGARFVVSRGKVTDATKVPRIVARSGEGGLVGLATYGIDEENRSCELITIDAVLERRGIGSRLIQLVEEAAREKGCQRVWLITTNDNLEAAAFYAKRGYRLVAVHLDALERSRELKSGISKVGKHGIPIQDEWEFEKRVAEED